MAFAIPRAMAEQTDRMSSGEAQLLAALTEQLPDDYVVYHNFSLTHRAPSFIVVGPGLGVVLLDVKDWRSESLVRVTDSGIEVLSGQIVLQNPVEQLRFAARKVLASLRAHPQLGTEAGLSWPVGVAVVFPFLTRADLQAPRPGGLTLAQALGSGDLITSDDLRGDLQAKIRWLVEPPAAPLTPQVIDAIRSTLYPQLQVRWASKVSVIDRDQERISHLPEHGHFLVEGPAGSGKTMTLLARARYLHERHPDWRIVVLTFNRVIADYLRDALEPDPRLDVLHFHAWCWRTLDRAGLEIPRPNHASDRTAYWTTTIPQLMLHTFKSGRLDPARVHAVLIDDGHDFPDAWYPVILQALHRETNSLFIVSDPRQAPRARFRDWRRLGVGVTDQQHRLSLNYRAPHQIFAAAAALVKDAGKAAVATGPGLQGGFAPDVRLFLTADAERKAALAWLRQRLTSGVPPENILILGLLRPEMAELETWLEDVGVPSRLLGGRSIPGVVRLSTIHGAKGLEADHVLLLQAHQLEQHRPDEARHLLYTAMTRARVQLAVYHHHYSDLLDELDGIVNPRTIMPWAPRPQRPIQPAAPSAKAS